MAEEVEEVEMAINSLTRGTLQQPRRIGSGDKNWLPVVKKKEAHPGGKEESSTQFRTPTNVSLDKKEADQGKQEGFAQFRTPTNDFRRLPVQVRNASPSFTLTNRGNRSLLQPVASPA